MIISVSIHGKMFRLVLCLCLVSSWSGTQASRTCPRGCACLDQQLLTKCNASAQLDYVPHTLNPNVRILVLSHNNIKSISSAFEVYKRLTNLDLSHNSLHLLEKNNFLSNSKIETLLLNNNEIGDIQSQAFAGLVALERLDLSNNKIDNLNESLFASMKALKHLDLTRNNINHVHDKAFTGLANLKSLNLSNNYLTIFSPSLFNPLSSLTHMNASLNPFVYIASDQFKALAKLASLDLSHCKINKIDRNAFSGLESIQYLDLEDNNLDTIPMDTFWRLTSLRVLNIGHNYFDEIPTKAFHNLKNLKFLHVSNVSTLKTIHHDAFYGLDNLEMLELSHNEMLQNVGRNVFDNLYSLSSLILTNNNLTTLEIDLITRYQRSDVYLDVRGNPFHCNCSLEWLKWHLIRIFNKTMMYNKDYLQEHNITVSYFNIDHLLNDNSSEFIIYENALDVKCVTPFALQEKLIIRMHKDKFGCFILDTIIPVVVGAFIGAAILIGVMVLMVIQCKYPISGLVKNQLYSDARHNQFDLYHKPDFVFYPNTNNIYRVNTRSNAEDLSARYPLRSTPTTEL